MGYSESKQANKHKNKENKHKNKTKERGMLSCSSEHTKNRSWLSVEEDLTDNNNDF